MQARLDIFQTLADPTRRRIVEALRHGEQQVNELVARAGIHQSGVSRRRRSREPAQEPGQAIPKPNLA